ncbi:hypothetical protein HDU76_005146 [Blyttiomyces sp. JEL0837]|nr:hypothetical protein HDU76_005146 [Blyttiomyces sp. JEL0837]
MTTIGVTSTPCKNPSISLTFDDQFDIVANDIVEKSAGSACECAYQCEQFIGCVAVSYVNDGSCWLKKTSQVGNGWTWFLGATSQVAGVLVPQIPGSWGEISYIVNSPDINSTAINCTLNGGNRLVPPDNSIIAFSSGTTLVPMPSAPSSNSGGAPVGIISAVSVIAILLIGLILAMLFIYLRKRGKKEENPESTTLPRNLDYNYGKVPGALPVIPSYEAHMNAGGGGVAASDNSLPSWQQQPPVQAPPLSPVMSAVGPQTIPMQGSMYSPNGYPPQQQMMMSVSDAYAAQAQFGGYPPQQNVASMPGSQVYMMNNMANPMMQMDPNMIPTQPAWSESERDKKRAMSSLFPNGSADSQQQPQLQNNMTMTMGMPPAYPVTDGSLFGNRRASFDKSKYPPARETQEGQVIAPREPMFVGAGVPKSMSPERMKSTCGDVATAAEGNYGQGGQGRDDRDGFAVAMGKGKERDV